MRTTQIISTSISREFYNLAKEHKISWCEAIRVGLSVLFAEKGIRGFDNKLNYTRRLEMLEEAFKELQKSQ
jgi:hypothetical protein